MVLKIATGNLQLNPFFRIRLGSPITCDLFLENKTLELPSPLYLKLFTKLTNLISKKEIITVIQQTFSLDDAESNEVLDNLISNKLLVDSKYGDGKLQGIQHWIDRGWLDALLLHLKSCDLEFDDSINDEPDNFNSEGFRELIRQEGLPEFWKEIKGINTVNLPNPTKLPTNYSFDEILLKRRSNRPWKQKTIELQELSNILYYSNIETVRLRTEAETNLEEKPELLLNSAFSALETYFFAFNIEGLEPGLYHYDPKNHAVILIKDGMFRDELVHMVIGQDRPKNAACAFVISAVWSRYMYRYRHPRAYRTLLVNIGELAQKYLTLGTAYDYSTFLTPALRDEYADSMLGVNGYEEAPLYVVAIG
ncbi:hypothetical protein COE50_25345 [Bacillus anthracis]|nr:hypothetical protein COK10_22590 [Bacillus anthracis]PGZ27906.1 hypothetical protein COE50_25345 [Bacillus anthracis]